MMKKSVRSAVLSVLLSGLLAASMLIPAYAATPGTIPSLRTRSSETHVAELAAAIDEIVRVADEGDYAYNGWQLLQEDAGGSVRVLRSDMTYPGNDVAVLAQEYGYTDAIASFYYDNPAVTGRSLTAAGPLFIRAEIDEKTYCYYFKDNQMIRRVGPEGTQDNLKANSFLKSLYKIAAESEAPSRIVSKDTVDVTVSSTVYPRFDGRAVRIYGTWNEGDVPREGLLSIDETTTLSPDCVTDTNYAEGDTALAWFKKKLVSDNPTDIMGVYSVDITGNHIDRIYGSFWWD